MWEHDVPCESSAGTDPERDGMNNGECGMANIMNQLFDFDVYI